MGLPYAPSQQPFISSYEVIRLWSNWGTICSVQTPFFIYNLLNLFITYYLNHLFTLQILPALSIRSASLHTRNDTPRSLVLQSFVLRLISNI
jgi:hypothetical protein